MTDPTPHSQRHIRTRRDHESETAEDYVEAIADITQKTGSCRVVDLARRFGVSHVTVIRTANRLQDEGLLTTEPYRPLILTSKGTALAAESRRRHEIVYQFLLAIGVDASTATTDAEGIEHHVSRKTLQRFRELTDQLTPPQNGGSLTDRKPT